MNGSHDPQGALRKMRATHADPVRYALPIGDGTVAVNDLLGRRIALAFTGEIVCVHCGRRTRTSFGQGHCWPCFRALASCDGCIVRPELCHHHLGTCREPAWGEAHCFVPHTVYLANSSGLKVGITRGTSAVGRWIDQGAAQGLAIRSVASRLESGEVEVALKTLVSDRTDWRRLLRGDADPVDLPAAAADLLARVEANRAERPLPGVPLPDATPVDIRYPVLAYPAKVRGLDPLKAPRVEGTLLGVKGQYLIFDVGVINVRKHAGWVARLEGVGDAAGDGSAGVGKGGAGGLAALTPPPVPGEAPSR